MFPNMQRNKPAANGAGLKSLTIRLPGKLIDRIKIRAVKDHISLQEMAGQAFEAYLKAAGGKEGTRDEA